MRLSHRCTSARLAPLFALFILTGCATTNSAPSGPGAASEANLSPWLKRAPTVTYTGELMYFHCTSDHGNFWTWALTPAGDEDAAEIDVRACANDAARLENQTVTITGPLIPREPRHFPLLVAKKITLANRDTVTNAD